MNQIDISEEFFSENQLDPSISNVTFHSDGVLDHIWFKNWFGPLRTFTYANRYRRVAS